MISGLQMVSQISISDGKPYELLPLSFIVAVTMLKDIYEDMKRHLFDNEENNRVVQVFDSQSLTFKSVKWSELRVGDVVKVSDGEGIPADMIIVKSADK
jgi:phospholipid-transporting ATPase